MAGALAASMLLGGCGQPASSGGAGAEAKDTGKVIILYPGEETDEMANFIDNQLNPRLKEEIGEEVELVVQGALPDDVVVVVLRIQVDPVGVAEIVEIAHHLDGAHVCLGYPWANR